MHIPIPVLRAGVAVVALTLASCPVTPPGTPATLPGAPDSGMVHWLRFVQISDSQICDEESPARALRFDWLIPYSWRPQENYGLHTLDATLQAINRRHAQSPIDFVLFTGDLVDGALGNELQWLLDTMDGQFVVPDSGEQDGSLRLQPAEDNPKLGFQAEGLNPAVPWYTVYGNHEELAVGVFGVQRAGLEPGRWTAPIFDPVAPLFGLTYLTPPQAGLSPTSGQSPAILLGSEELLDPETLQLYPSRLEYGPIAPDPARAFLSRQRFIDAHFDTRTQPLGHGFTENNRARGTTHYSVRPLDDIPLRLIVLDTVVKNPPLGLPVEFGVLRRDEFESFVLPELQSAEDAGEWVFVVSHHPSGDFDRFYPGDVVGTAEFRESLAGMPNVIAHLCGHSHRHRVFRIEGTHPYFEIETASLVDYPQEGRVFDLYYDPALNQVQLLGETFGHAEAPTRLSAESLRRAEFDAEFNGLPKTETPDLETYFPGMGAIGSAPHEDRERFTPASPQEKRGTNADRIIDHRSTWPKP